MGLGTRIIKIKSGFSGIFSEDLDLIGDRLNGVVVVGVGLLHNN